jgi:hypothetical protein
VLQKLWYDRPVRTQLLIAVGLILPLLPPSRSQSSTPPRRRQAPARGAGLTVTDDGKNIDTSTTQGFGLTTMTERIRSLGSSCVIDSELEKGTIIRIEIPVQREKAERPKKKLELVGGMS